MSAFPKTHTQAIPSQKWNIALPSDAFYPEVTAVFDINKMPVNWEYQVKVENGHLVLDFGLDNRNGYARYVYETDDDVAVDKPVYEEDETPNPSPDPDPTPDPTPHTVTIDGNVIHIVIDTSKV